MDRLKMNLTGNATKMFYSAERSYGDISAATMFQDMDMVFIGAALMFIYMEIVLSRFGWTEFRVCTFCKLFDVQTSVTVKIQST